MNKLIIALALLVSQISFASTQEEFKLIHVKDLASMVADKSANVAIYDCNSNDTRKEDGVIPGAKLLSSSKHYDVSKMLPADKETNLVFYCANTACMASHAAAERATQAGYKNVAVMAEGIQGWKKAGQATAKP